MVQKLDGITGTSQTIKTLGIDKGVEQHIQRVTMLNETSSGADLLIGENSDIPRIHSIMRRSLSFKVRLGIWSILGKSRS